MKFHELADLFPLMEGKAFDELVEDVCRNGLVEPITVYEGKIIDGRNRYRACMKGEIKPRFIEFDGSVSVLNFIVSRNLHRRHLSTGQRAIVAAKFANLQHGQRKSELPNGNCVTRSEAAALLNVSGRSISRAKMVLEKGIPELQKAVEAGEISVATAERYILLPPDAQREAMRVAPKQRAVKPKSAKPPGYMHGVVIKNGRRYATEAMEFAVMSISQLERIRSDDPRKAEALEKVRDWCIEQLNRRRGRHAKTKPNTN